MIRWPNICIMILTEYPDQLYWYSKVWEWVFPYNFNWLIAILLVRHLMRTETFVLREECHMDNYMLSVTSFLAMRISKMIKITHIYKYMRNIHSLILEISETFFYWKPIDICRHDFSTEKSISLGNIYITGILNSFFTISKVIDFKQIDKRGIFLYRTVFLANLVSMN